MFSTGVLRTGFGLAVAGTSVEHLAEHTIEADRTVVVVRIAVVVGIDLVEAHSTEEATDSFVGFEIKVLLQSCIFNRTLSCLLSSIREDLGRHRFEGNFRDYHRYFHPFGMVSFCI